MTPKHITRRPLLAGTIATLAIVVTAAWVAYSYRQGDAAASVAPAALPQVVVSKPLERGVDSRLVARFSQIEGYRCLSLMRALGVAKCQFALVWLALRSCSQAVISSMRVCLSGMRRSRHWDDRTPSSDSARSSQLPCFGV